MKNLAAFFDICVYVTEPGQHNGPHGTARLKNRTHAGEKGVSDTEERIRKNRIFQFRIF